MAPQTPVVNAGLYYVNGLELRNLVIPSTPVSPYVSGKALIVQPGYARDVTNTNDLFLPQALDSAGDPYELNGYPVGAVINGLVVGANGVDVSVLAINKMYAVYVIGASNSVFTPSDQLAGGPSPNPLGPIAQRAPANPFPVAAILSLDHGAPALPLGYDMYRRIGWACTDNAGNLAKFWQYGGDQYRAYYWDVCPEVLAAGASAAYANVALNLATTLGAGIPSIPVPAEETQVIFDVALAGAAKVEFQPFGSTATDGIIRFESAGAAIASQVVPCGLNGNVPTVRYKVSASSVTLKVSGFYDLL